jgi:hypothetical protein
VTSSPCHNPGACGSSEVIHSEVPVAVYDVNARNECARSHSIVLSNTCMTSTCAPNFTNSNLNLQISKHSLNTINRYNCVLGFWWLPLYELHACPSMWSEAEALSEYGVVPNNLLQSINSTHANNQLLHSRAQHVAYRGEVFYRECDQTCDPQLQFGLCVCRERARNCRQEAQHLQLSPSSHACRPWAEAPPLTLHNLPIADFLCNNP